MEWFNSQLLTSFPTKGYLRMGSRSSSFLSYRIEPSHHVDCSRGTCWSLEASWRVRFSCSFKAQTSSGQNSPINQKQSRSRLGPGRRSRESTVSAKRNSKQVIGGCAVSDSCGSTILSGWCHSCLRKPASLPRLTAITYWTHCSG